MPTRPSFRTPGLTRSSSCWRGGAARSSAAATANGSSRLSTAAPRPRGGAIGTERNAAVRRGNAGPGLPVAARQARRDRARAPARAARPIPWPRGRIRRGPRAARSPARRPGHRRRQPGARRRPRGVLNRGPGEAPRHLGAARRPPGSRPALLWPPPYFPAIRQDAAGRSSAAEAFTGLPGVYVEAVISAFWQAAQEGTALDWPPVLNLCSWADQQAEAELRAPGDRLRRQWEAARMASPAAAGSRLRRLRP